MSSDNLAANLPQPYREQIAQLKQKLPALLGANLFSLVLYGSAVRGNIVDNISDLNILIILNESTPAAHAAIAEAISGKILVEPLVISRTGMERSFTTFAMKFRSIQRNYTLLAGTDPFDGITISEPILRFLCEQAIRNLRLRTVHAFIRHGRDAKRYRQFLIHIESQIIIELAEVLRLNGSDMPNAFPERITAIQNGFGIDAGILKDLLLYKEKPRRLKYEEAKQFHSNLFHLLDQVVRWMEARWPMTM